MGRWVDAPLAGRREQGWGRPQPVSRLRPFAEKLGWRFSLRGNPRSIGRRSNPRSIGRRSKLELAL
jgi:hypothetical protein